MKKNQKKSPKDPSGEVITLQGPELVAFMQQLTQETIVPHVNTVAPIMGGGGVAVVLRGGASGVDPEVEPMLRAFGWDGKAAAFAASKDGGERMAQGCERMGDQVTARWFRSQRQGRLFLVYGKATLLLNLDPQRGWYIEPGSTNDGWMN